MTPAALPVDMIGLAGLLLVIIGSLARIHMTQRAAAHDTRTIRDQVHNDPPSQHNLRHDIDLIKAAIHDLTTTTATGFADAAESDRRILAELSAERQRSIVEDAAIRDLITHHHPNPDDEPTHQ